MTENAKENFLKHLEFAAGRQAFSDCPYYPCHQMKGGATLNCTLCYCPFYPCRGRVGTGKWIYDKKSGKIWDCSPCDFIQRSDVVRRITELLYENRKFSQIKKIIAREFLTGRMKAGE
jgi:Zn-finger protein